MGFSACGKNPRNSVCYPHDRPSILHATPTPTPAAASRLPLPRASVETPLLPFIPDRKAQLSNWAQGFGTDVRELAGDWESGDLHPGLTAATPPPPHPLQGSQPAPRLRLTPRCSCSCG